MMGGPGDLGGDLPACETGEHGDALDTFLWLDTVWTAGRGDHCLSFSTNAKIAALMTAIFPHIY